MAASRIEWTEQTWNPVTGCTEISAGCRHVRARSAMAVTTSKNPAGLRLARRFDAAPERVFAAWLDPGAARKWLFATPSEHPVEIDDWPGGLRLLIPNRWGGVEAVIAYLEIAPPCRLVCDLTLPYFSPDDADRLTVEIAPDGAGCVLTLLHEGPPPDYWDRIEQGWAEMFDDLASMLG